MLHEIAYSSDSLLFIFWILLLFLVITKNNLVILGSCLIIFPVISFELWHTDPLFYGNWFYLLSICITAYTVGKIAFTVGSDRNPKGKNRKFG